MPTFTRRSLLAALLFVPLFAGDFWNEKRSSEWDEREVERVLTNSPWAKAVLLKPVGQATVRWASAEPVQRAVARRDQGGLSLPSAPRRIKAYVITVSGLNLKGLPSDPRDRREMLVSAATLKASGRMPLQPDSAQVDDRELEFRFANDEPIESPAIDFTLKLGKTVVKCRFHTAAMQFDGKLAL